MFEIEDFKGQGCVRAIAPAKVNLFLDVKPKSDEAMGFHEVCTIMQTLSLHDVLHMRLRPLQQVQFEMGDKALDEGGLPRGYVKAGTGGRLLVRIEMLDKTSGEFDKGACPIESVTIEDNLIFKAIDRLARRCGRDQDECLDVLVEKRIPMQAGLGGGSSDAASAMVGALKLWGVIGLESEQDSLGQDSCSAQVAEDMMLQIAAELGSDISFFLLGGCQTMEGKGDVLRSTLVPMKDAIVLIKPTEGVSTKDCYEAFDRIPNPAPDSMVAANLACDLAENVVIFNSLAPAAESLCNELTRVREWLLTQPGIDAANVCLSGSGSAAFAKVSDFATASKIAGDAKLNGWWARAVSCSSLKASVL